MDVLNYNFIRLGLTGAKALQTAIRFPRETRRRFAVPKSNAYPLNTYILKSVSTPEVYQYPKTVLDSLKRVEYLKQKIIRWKFYS